MVAISFLIKVSPPPTVIVQFLVGVNAGIVVKDGEAKPYEPTGDLFEDFENACPGTSGEPKAAKGFLCVYMSEAAEGSSFITEGTSIFEGSNDFGVTLPYRVRGEGGGYVRGSWAVTAS